MTSVERGATPATAAELVKRARSFGPDELPDDVAGPSSRRWYYPWAQYEAGALLRVIDEARRTNRFVDYTDNVGIAASTAVFRADASESGTLHLRATGRLTVRVSGDGPVSAAADTELRIDIRDGDAIEVLVDTGEETQPAALSVRASDPPTAWRTATHDERWRPPTEHAGDDLPPHRRGEPTIETSLARIADGFYALPAPMLGRLSIRTNAGTPTLTTGESMEEAAAEPAFAESRADLIETAPGTFLSRNALGMRFASVMGADASSVAIRAHIRPAPRRGAFVTSDPLLNRIWSTSAYTLRLCMQTFLLDGIKRDRLPWIGDHALGILTNAFAFADAEIVRNTLVALGRPRGGYINGIADYSLWWVISHGLYQTYFGDAAFAAAEADHIHAFLEDLASHTRPDGVLRPLRVPGSFEHTGPGAVFLDWGVSLRAESDPTALQILWFWALESGARVLDHAGHPGAAGWTERAERMRDVLVRRAWNPVSRLWREYLDSDDEPSAYPSFLATLAGIMPDGADEEETARFLAASSTGTPFMRSFALLALGRLGERTRAVAEVRRLWGRMIDAGATSFWEEFDSGGSPYEMYRRPFGKSLCHAWAAGPAALLPELVLGLRPLHDGWAEFAVDPELGALTWADAVVPTPHGEIVVQAGAENVRVDVPFGSTLVHGDRRHVGPAMVILTVRDRGQR